MTTPAVGALIAGKYVLERPLARGGMGAVWVGRHRDLDVGVAVKFMDQTLIASADARARFEREAKAAAKLETKHVVHVLDYGVDAGTPYIVMELLKGEDLAGRLGRERTMELGVTAGILGQVAKGLRKAHEAGLVHRDLKPANIFLAVKDDEEVVKILDFGIAKATGTGFAGKATETGVVVGSVHYMSPEQVRQSKLVDARSDLWSLGVILFRMVTGRLPFSGDEIGDVLVKVCTDPVPVPSEVAPGLPGEVDVFFAKALARRVEERFQSAGEMAEAFAGVAGMPGILRQAMVSLPVIEPVMVGDAATTEVETQVWQPAKGGIPAAATEPLPGASVEPFPAAPAEPVSGMGTLTPTQDSAIRPGRPRRALLKFVIGGMIATAIMVALFVVPHTATKAPASAVSSNVSTEISVPVPLVTQAPAVASTATEVSPAVPVDTTPMPVPSAPSPGQSAGVPPLPPKNRPGTVPLPRPTATPSTRPAPSTSVPGEKPVDLP